MRFLFCLTFLFSSFLKPEKSQALIYGIDDRREALSSWAKPWAPAVLLMASKQFVIDDGTSDNVALDFAKVSGDGSLVGLCSKERFSQQASAGVNCTGFLIAPDLVVTAGHCISPYGRTDRAVTPACSDFVWIADFVVNSKRGADALEHDPKKWPRSKIFECAEVIEASHPDFSNPEWAPPVFGDDFALVRLKTKAIDRPVFKISESTRPAPQLYSLGFPLGIPLKLAGPARILDNNFEKFFAINLDAFMGNSGSPIFDAQGLVHGILVRGYPSDLLEQTSSPCGLVNSCNETGTRCQESSQFFATGEHVQRMQPLLEAVNKYQGRETQVAKADTAPSTIPWLQRPASKARPRTFIDSNLERPGAVAPKKSSPTPF